MAPINGWMPGNSLSGTNRRRKRADAPVQHLPKLPLPLLLLLLYVMMASYARSTNSYARSSKRICSKMWRAPQAPKLSTRTSLNDDKKNPGVYHLVILSFWLVGVGITDPKSSANRWAKGRSACPMCLWQPSFASAKIPKDCGSIS